MLQNIMFCDLHGVVSVLLEVYDVRFWWDTAAAQHAVMSLQKWGGVYET